MCDHIAIFLCPFVAKGALNFTLVRLTSVHFFKLEFASTKCYETYTQLFLPKNMFMDISVYFFSMS